MKSVEVISLRKTSLLLALQYDHKGLYTYSPLVEIYTIYAKVPLLTFHLFFHFYEQFTARTNDFLVSINTLMKLPNDL